MNTFAIRPFHPNVTKKKKKKIGILSSPQCQRASQQHYARIESHLVSDCVGWFHIGDWLETDFYVGNGDAQ